MKSNSIRNCGTFSLVLGIALASGAVYAVQDTGAKSGFIKLTESKAYRDTRKDEEQADKQDNGQEKSEPRSEPIVNDYSSMGADGDSKPEAAAERARTASQEIQGKSEEASGPIVNDYSNMGAEFTAKKESPDEAASESSGNSAAPGDFSTAFLAIGHVTYNANCAQCHGQDGVGSTFAPSLVNSLKRLDYVSFVDVVTNGKISFNTSTGGYNVMPGWKNNAAVMEYMNPLWGYLKARADGDLGTGRPQ
jgi:mono/diheme cytochrome c family protein